MVTMDKRRQRRRHLRRRQGQAARTCARDLGSGADLTVVSDQGPAVSKSIYGLTTEGALGLLFAVLVILVFLASIRSTLVTAVSIPLSVVLALIVLWTRDLSLNMLTLGALTIAIGRVVDDSIVVLENIKRHLGYGEERAGGDPHRGPGGGRRGHLLHAHHRRGVPADRPGRRHGRRAVRLVLADRHGGPAGLAAGLADRRPGAVVLVPARPEGHARRTPDEARRTAEEKEARSRLQRVYVPVLRFATRRRLTSVVIAVVVLIGTFGMAPLLKTNFFDQGEQEVLTVKQELEPGTSLAATDAAAKKVEKLLAGIEGVKDYQVTVGSSGFMAAFGGGTGANQASYQVTLEDSATVRGRPGHASRRASASSTASATTTDRGRRRLRQPGPERRREGRRRGRPAQGVRAGPRRGRRRSTTSRTSQSDLAQSVPAHLGEGQRQGGRGRLQRRRRSARPSPRRSAAPPAGKAILDDTERDVVIKSAEPGRRRWPSCRTCRSAR